MFRVLRRIRTYGWQGYKDLTYDYPFLYWNLGVTRRDIIRCLKSGECY